MHEVITVLNRLQSQMARYISWLRKQTCLVLYTLYPARCPRALRCFILTWLLCLVVFSRIVCQKLHFSLVFIITIILIIYRVSQKLYSYISMTTVFLGKVFFNPSKQNIILTDAVKTINNHNFDQNLIYNSQLDNITLVQTSAEFIN